MTEKDQEINKDVNKIIQHLLKKNDSYTLSTKQINEIGNALIDATKPEIRSNIAYVIGYYARNGLVGEIAA